MVYRPQSREEGRKMSSLKLVCSTGLVYNTIPDSNPPSGGNASVFKVSEDTKIVAKILKSELNHGNRKKRFLFETDLLEQYSLLTSHLPCFKGKGLVDKNTKEEWGGSPFYLMESLETWNSFIKKIKTVEEKFDFCFQLAEAIDNLHDLSIAHRDIKPKNLLLRNKQDKKVVVISDLGLAISDDREGFDTWTNECIGSEGFRPPELLFHNRDLKPEDYYFSDVYQFVKTVYCVFKEELRPFPDDQHAIKKDLELQKYEKDPFMEEIYQMIEEGIKESLLDRPTIIGCIKRLRKAHDYYRGKKEYDDYFIDKELRRLKAVAAINGGCLISDSYSIISFFDSIPIVDSLIKRVIGSQEEMVIKEICGSQDIFLNANGSVWQTSDGESTKIRQKAYKISVQKNNDTYYVSFIVYRMFASFDELRQKQICVSIRKIINPDTMEISNQLEDFRIIKFGKKPSDNIISIEGIDLHSL